MNELKNAINTIETKGYIVCNMIYDNNEYEIYKDTEVIIDHLSESQVIQLSNVI